MKTGCCQCSTLNETGVLMSVVIVLLAWPVACVVCLMPSMHEDYQVPVYGYPQQQQGGTPQYNPPKSV